MPALAIKHKGSLVAFTRIILTRITHTYITHTYIAHTYIFHTGNRPDPIEVEQALKVIGFPKRNLQLNTSIGC